MSAQRIAIAYDCLFPYTTGGGERLYRTFAERLTARGRQVDYLTALQWDESDPPAHHSFRVVAVSPRLRLYDAAGVRRTSAALRYAWSLFRALRRRRGDYDAVIVSGLPLFNVFAARAALVGSGTTVTVDYLEVWGRAQWAEYAGAVTGTIAWILQALALAVTPLATCHSQLTARQIRRTGFRGTLLVSPGLIEEAPEQTAATPAAPPVVLYAGRHIPDKRVESLPAAVAYARERVPGLRLVILGEGSSTPAVRDAVASYAAEAWVELPGFVGDDELAEAMATAACLVNPSRREGYGLVVVESAAKGTPVVLVDGEGNAAVELVENGQNGFVAESVAPADLGSAIVRVLEGGSALRSRTHEWFADAVRTRSVDRTLDNLLAALDGAGTGTVADLSTPPQQGTP